MWIIFTVVHYMDGHTDYLDVQGPWPLKEVNAYIELVTKYDKLSSVEFTLIPKF